jgi:hypothetical protein
MGYVTVEDEAANALPFECETAFKPSVPAIVTLPDGMEAGRSVVLRIGDRRFGGPGIYARPSRYARAHVRVGVSLPGEARFRVVPDATTSVQIVPCPPLVRYHLFAPSTVRPGQTFLACGLPVDVNGNAMAPAEKIELNAGEGGTAEVDSVGPRSLRVRATFEGERVARLELHDLQNDLAARSNPVRVSPTGPNVYWGEFHCHGYDAVEINVLNEGTHPAGAFAYGRDVTRLDFMAMGSHIFRRNPQAVEQWWELYREAAAAHDEPERYVTFLGCEWRDREERGGDRNLVWKDLDAPMPDPTWTIEEVYERFRPQEAMVIPHVGGAIADPCCHDPQMEWLCEMVSGHGNFEWFAQAYLQEGYRVGLIGGSDGHKATPGHPRMVERTGGRFFDLLRRRDSGWGGGPLLAVCGDRLDRQALWQAFRQRRVYASTGARALVEFRVNGAMMGAETEARNEARVEAEVHGTAPLRRIDLIRGTRRLHRWDCTEEVAELSLSDRPPDGETHYYLRIEQADGEMLWTAPVWVRSTCGGSDEGLPAWNAPEQIDPDAVGTGEAGEHLPDLLRYLRTEEKVEAFTDVTPFGVVHSPRGSYAVFLARVRGKRVRIHWFYEFEMPRLRLEVGWVHYGRERIKGQPWTAPLLEGQDRMG